MSRKITRFGLIERCVQSIVRGRSPATALAELLDPQDDVGKTLDKLLQHINHANLLDYYLGANWEGEGANLRLYFSEHADKRTLLLLTQNVTEVAGRAELKQSDDPDAKWMVVTDRVITSQPEIQGGQIPVEISLSGDLEIKGGS